MNQRETIQEYLRSISPAAIKPKDLAELLGIPATSCAVVLSGLANTEGSGVHRIPTLGYKYDAPSMEELELQEMFWHDKFVATRKTLVATEEALLLEMHKTDKQALRIKYQQEAITALQKLQDLNEE